MEFTVKTDEFRRALLQASITGSKSPELYNFLRMDFYGDFCVLSCTNGEIVVRTRLRIYDSSLQEQASFVLKDFNNLLKTSYYLLYPIVTISFDKRKKKASLRSGEKRLSVSLSEDQEFAMFQEPSNKSITEGCLKYEVALLHRRFKKIKYAADKNTSQFNRIFFDGPNMYATDSRRIAVSSSKQFETKNEFSVKVNTLELICNTLDTFVNICKEDHFLIFSDNKGNEIICPVEEPPSFDYKKILNAAYKYRIETNAALFCSSLEFIQSYLTGKINPNSPMVIAWRNEVIRVVGDSGDVETKIPVSDNFDFTLFFSLSNLLGVIKQFGKKDIVIEINEQLAPIKISCDEEDLGIIVPMRVQNDPFDIAEEKDSATEERNKE